MDAAGSSTASAISCSTLAAGTPTTKCPHSLPLVLELSPQGNRCQAGLRVYPIVSDNQITGYQPRFVSPEQLSEIDALLAEKGHWNSAHVTAVKGAGRDRAISRLPWHPELPLDQLPIQGRTL